MNINQRMAASHKAKGYAYRYVFAEAAGHTDGRVTRQTLPGALEWLWQEWAKSRRAHLRLFGARNSFRRIVDNRSPLRNKFRAPICPASGLRKI